MYEHWLSRRSTNPVAQCVPPMAEYLYFAQRSIGLKLLWATGVILEADLEILPHINQFMRFAEICAPSLRLANDLATYQREMLSSGVNAVVIGIHDRTANELGLAHEEALARTLMDLRRNLSESLEKARTLDVEVAELKPLMQRMLRGLELGVEIYQVRDLREWDQRGQTGAGGFSGPATAESL